MNRLLRLCVLQQWTWNCLVCNMNYFGKEGSRLRMWAQGIPVFITGSSFAVHIFIVLEGHLETPQPWSSYKICSRYNHKGPSMKKKLVTWPFLAYLWHNPTFFQWLLISTAAASTCSSAVLNWVQGFMPLWTVYRLGL